MRPTGGTMGQMLQAVLAAHRAGGQKHVRFGARTEAALFQEGFEVPHDVRFGLTRAWRLCGMRVEFVPGAPGWSLEEGA